MTEKTYYREPYTETIVAHVTAVSSYKSMWAIQLDRTIFYPEGGGQPGDRGMIDDYAVIDTIKHHGDILHLVKEEPSLELGSSVQCRIDWDNRYDYMQQHTGQHIISGVLYSALGIGTVSVHQGDEYTTIEIDRDGISEDEIMTVEEKANRIISRNLPVTYEERSDEEVAKIALRRAPKVKGMIRLVSIEECDLVACGGVHLHTTGEVQLIKCIGTESIRGRVRLIWKIGRRAIDDYRAKDRIVRELVTLYSARQCEIVAQARHRIDQVKELQMQVSSVEQKLAEIYLAGELAKTSSAAGVAVVTFDATREAPGFLKRLVHAMPADRSAALCAVQEMEKGGLQWIMAVSGEAELDISRIRGELFPLIDAKGGGRPPVLQGMGKDVSGKDRFLEAFAMLFR